MNKDQRYNKKRQVKTVSFLKEEHRHLLEYANSLDDFSARVRDLLKAEMESKNEMQSLRNEIRSD